MIRNVVVRKEEAKFKTDRFVLESKQSSLQLEKGNYLITEKEADKYRCSLNEKRHKCQCPPKKSILTRKLRLVRAFNTLSCISKG